MFTAALLIDGTAMPARGEAIFERIDPVSREVATRAAAAGIEDARHAANVAARAFPAWSATSPAARRACLERGADAILAREDEFVEAMVTETGGTAGWARFNCALAARHLREAAAITDQILGETLPSDNPDILSTSLRQPCGVVFSLAPWNAPVVLAVRGLALPLACGNTVVLKASELCPRTHSLLAETMQEAGLPHGVLNLLHSSPETTAEVVETVIAHPAVRRVTFTGSTRIGRRIAEVAARHLKRCVLELSGKCPLLVLDDADLDAAVDAAVFGSFYHQGQICMATERVIVDARIADAFLLAFKARAEAIPAGDPREPGRAIGAMITEDAARRVKGLIDDAVLKGARLIAGGRQDGPFLDPTILEGVTPAMRIYAEESFGPVACVMRVVDEEEAIFVANDTEYGLSAAVFSRDTQRAMAVARRLETGICHINGATIDDEPQAPFGGVKASGYGRFGGKAGIDEFTELRWLTMATGARRYPI